MRKVRVLFIITVLSLVYAYTGLGTPGEAPKPAVAQEAPPKALPPHHNLTIIPEPLVYSTSQAGGAKRSILFQARSFAGTTYHQKSWNCSDYTRAVYGRASGVHVWMIDWDDKQLGYGYHPSHRKRADLVFFDENGSNDWDGPVSHVAVYAGKTNGIPYIFHSSAYYGMVVKTPLTWVTRPDGKQAYVPRYTRRIR